MHKLIIIIMDTNTRWQKLPKSNLSLRRRREIAVAKRLVAYATSEDKRTALIIIPAVIQELFQSIKVHIRRKSDFISARDKKCIKGDSMEGISMDIIDNELKRKIVMLKFQRTSN